MKHALFLARNQRLTTLAVVALLAGCALPAPQSWRVEPNYRISHAEVSSHLGYKALAHQYESEHRWREARDAWQKAALEAPEDADLLNALGLAEAGQGRYGNAVTALRRAVALAPERVNLINNLGYALLLDGQKTEAKSVLQAALARSPEHPLVRINLNRLDPGAPDTRQTQHLQTTPNLEPMPLRQASVAEPLPLLLASKKTEQQLSPARIEIANGNGVTGLATWLGAWLRVHDVAHHTSRSNALPFDTLTSVVHYRAGYREVAQKLADGMPRRVKLAPESGGTLHADVRVVLGRDLRAMATCSRPEADCLNQL